MFRVHFGLRWKMWPCVQKTACLRRRGDFAAGLRRWLARMDRFVPGERRGEPRLYGRVILGFPDEVQEACLWHCRLTERWRWIGKSEWTSIVCDASGWRGRRLC